ncbi:MAG: hypothetical protein KUL86_06740 [Castellaniella sp.]|nr:hypothetical protein [Castellaniella sp.]
MQFTRLDDITGTISAMNEVEQTGQTERTPAFYRPFHFVLLALTMQRCGSPDFQLTGNDAKFAAYAARMNLWEALGKVPPITVNKHDATGRFHPLTRLDNPDAVDEVSLKLSHLFGPPGNENVRSIDIAVSEVVGNSYAHSSIRTGLRGLVCAQKWPGGNKAQIAIGDCGIGVRRSLMCSPEHQDMSLSVNACELATQYEVTSKRGAGHSGYGLTLARQLIENNGGAFFLISNDEYYVSSAGRTQFGRLADHLPGTLVIMEWNTHIPLSARRVYDSWPSPDEGDDYDFDF